MYWLIRRKALFKTQVRPQSENMKKYSFGICVSRLLGMKLTSKCRLCGSLDSLDHIQKRKNRAYLAITTLQTGLQASYSHHLCCMCINFIHKCRRLQFNGNVRINYDLPFPANHTYSFNFDEES